MSTEQRFESTRNIVVCFIQDSVVAEVAVGLSGKERRRSERRLLRIRRRRRLLLFRIIAPSGECAVNATNGFYPFLEERKERRRIYEVFTFFYSWQPIAVVCNVRHGITFSTSTSKTPTHPPTVVPPAYLSPIDHFPFVTIIEEEEETTKEDCCCCFVLWSNIRRIKLLC